MTDLAHRPFLSRAACVVVGLRLTLSNAKPCYLGPAYPMIMAAGAVAVTARLGGSRRIARGTSGIARARGAGIIGHLMKTILRTMSGR